MQSSMPSTRRTLCTIFHRWHECNGRRACDYSLSTDVLITLLWGISYLLICTRLHEFEPVPYIIINLPHKPRGTAFYLFTEWRQMMPNKPALRAKCVLHLTGQGPVSITVKSHPNPVRPRRRLHDLIGAALSWPVLLSGPRGRAPPGWRVRGPRCVIGQRKQHLIYYYYYFPTHTYMSFTHGLDAVMLIQRNKQFTTNTSIINRLIL